MEIARDLYLRELILRKHNGSVKVVTGIRRVGKSYLLFEQFTRHLKESGTDDAHIIQIALDDPEHAEYCKPITLLQHLKSLIHDENMYYILLDEVQLLDNFEGVLNSLLRLRNVDIYVTGSNSKFLSKDILTEFRGRGDEVHLYPLSFREFMSVYPHDRYAGWEEYITYGGLPGVVLRPTPQQKMLYLKNLFSETYLKDVITRNHIRNTFELETLLDILSSSVGSLTNPERIMKTFQSVEKTSLSKITIKSYIDALEDAFLITSAKRYDVRGRKYIGSPQKYYFEDVGLRNARLNFRQMEKTYLMENVIYNELRSRGYAVDVGVVERRERNESRVFIRKYFEIDFVVNQGSKRYYIQSAFASSDEEKYRQEQKSLVLTGDSFKKIVIVKDPVVPLYDDNGILTMNIFDFLMDADSLEKI